jgi:hypothetical protein
MFLKVPSRSTGIKVTESQQGCAYKEPAEEISTEPVDVLQRLRAEISKIKKNQVPFVQM